MSRKLRLRRPAGDLVLVAATIACLVICYRLWPGPGPTIIHPFSEEDLPPSMPPAVAEWVRFLLAAEPGRGNVLPFDWQWRRTEAAHRLASMGPAAAPAIPILVRSLKSGEKVQQPHAGGGRDESTPEIRQALVAIAPSAVPALTAALTDSDALRRVHAARALWELGAPVERVLPPLLAAWRDPSLFDEDEIIRREAGLALAEVAKRRVDLVLPTLRQALVGTDRYLAFAAEKVLPEVATGSPEARTKGPAAAVRKLLDDPDPRVCRAAEKALREIDP